MGDVLIDEDADGQRPPPWPDPRAVSRAALTLAARAYLSQPAEDALGALMEALDTARTAQDVWAQAEACRMLALWHWEEGHEARGAAYGHRAFYLFEEAGDERKAADARFNLGGHLTDPQESRASLQHARECYQRLDLPTDEADCWLVMARTTQSQGHLHPALDEARKAIELFFVGQAWEGVVRASSVLCQILWELGDVDGARALLAEASGRLVGRDEPTWSLLSARADFGLLLIRSGMPAEAIPHLRWASAALQAKGYDESASAELHRMWSREEWKWLVSESLVGLGEALILAGHLQEGFHGLQLAEAWCGKHGTDQAVRLGLAKSLYFLYCEQPDRAEHVLLPLLSHLTGLPVDERGPDYDRVLGAVEMNLHACWVRDDLDEAQERLDTAAARFSRPQDEEVRQTVAVHRALLKLDQDDWEDACRMLADVSAALERRGAEARAAQCHLLRGDVLERHNALSEGLAAARAAAAISSRLGMTHVHASADALVAWLQFLLETEQVDELPAQRVHELLDVLVPAALSLGALRLTLRDAPSRAALALAFEQALDRAAIVALHGDDDSIFCELAETARLFGVLSQPTAHGAQALALALPLGQAHVPAAGELLRSLAVAEHLAAPASQLDTAAKDLALSPPPMLRLPWGVVALERFHGMGEERYGIRMTSSEHVLLAATV